MDPYGYYDYYKTPKAVSLQPQPATYVWPEALRPRHLWAHALVATAAVVLLIIWGANIGGIQKISYAQYAAFEYGPRNAGFVALKILTIMVFFALAFAAAQWYPLALVPLFMFYIFILLFLLTQNCASYNMCTYDTKARPRTTQTGDVVAAFVAISDPQMISRTDDIVANEALIDSLNDFQRRLREGDPALAAIHPQLKHLIATRAVPEKLVIGGDLTQTGNAGQALGHANLVEDFERLYGLNKEGRARYFIYECLGNHDFDSTDRPDYGSAMDHSAHAGRAFAQRYIVRRNAHRRDVVDKDDRAGHYIARLESGVYLINLNVCIEGAGFVVTPSAHAQGSLDFLRRALSHVGADDHYFILCHYPACNSEFEHDPYYAALRAVLDTADRQNQLRGVLHGHVHLRDTYTRRVAGLPMFNLPSPIYGRPLPDYHRDPNYRVSFAVFVIANDSKKGPFMSVLNVSRLLRGGEFMVTEIV